MEEAATVDKLEEDTLTFDLDDALVRGQIPLHVFKERLQKIDESKIKAITFAKNGYCNDALLKLMYTEKKKNYENLTSIDLVGCTMITNAGIKWLSELIVGATKLEVIGVEGNRNITDNELSLLLKNTSSGCRMVMTGTSVSFTYLPEGRNIEFNGCPLMTQMMAKDLSRHAHALVIPHDSVEHSLTEYVDSKKLAKRQSLNRKSIEVGDWIWNFTEMSLNHPLLDCILNSNQAQIVIPFGESAVLKEVIKHVTDIILRTVTKMAYSTNYLKNVDETNKEIPMDVDNFITVHHAPMQQLDGNVLGNFCYDSEILGCFISGTPLTRSNPYFEIELVESKIVDAKGNTTKLHSYDDDSDDSDEEGEVKSGVLIGCLFERLYSCKNPLEIDVEKGGEVSTFEFKTAKKFGFGIRGKWISEYIPSSSAKFFATQDGVENNKDLTGVSVPQELLLPLVACLGDKNNASKVRITNMVKPPQELVEKWMKEKKWITRAHTSNILMDVNGVISHDSSSKQGTFVSMESVEDEFSIKILERGNFGKIIIALSPEIEKDKDIQKSQSWIFQGVTGEVISTEQTKYLVDPSRVESGDVLTVKLENGPDESMKVVALCKNDQRIVETNYKPLRNVGRNVVKLHISIEDGGKVHLLNYRPKYKGPILFPESLTVGRLHSMQILDNGTLNQVDIVGKQREENLGACFIAKSPLNSKLLSFEVENLTVPEKDNTKNTVYVGLCDPDINQLLTTSRNPHGYFKISGGTALFSSDGRLFKETSQGEVKKENFVLMKGDKIKCEVDKVPSAQKLNFDEDGNILPQQDVLIKFYVNDALICDYTMTLKSEGLYPAVFMDEKMGPARTVMIHKFYAETQENKTKANLQKNVSLQKKKADDDAKKKETTCPEFEDCQYIVVEVGKTAGKLQLVEDQLKGDVFSSVLENLSKTIDHFEKNFSTMDLNDQIKYATLYDAKEKIQNLVKKPKRISYMSLDMTSNKGLDKLLEKMSDIMDCRKTHQETKFLLPKKSIENLNYVADLIAEQRIIEFGPGIKDFGNKTLKMNGNLFLQNAKLLHEQGRVVLIQLSARTVIADPHFLNQAMELLDKIASMEMSGKLSTAINESSHVWTEEAAWILFKDWDKKIPLLLDILQQYTGLIELPAWRTGPDDAQFIYTTLESLSAPPIPLRDFWSKGDRTKDFVVMQKTFSFIHSISDHILSALLSAATKYGRTLLLTPQGAVFQIGCVQTVIVTHQGLMDLKFSDLRPSFDNTVISIESKCYLPDKKSGPVDELTEVYVKEYTWNVFCLYTDMLEKVLKQRNIIFMVSGDYPTDLVNISVGCKHCWKRIPGKANQSVCTMCNKCCDLGRKCKYNGIMGDNLRECPCKTSASGCEDCGICIDCAERLWSTRSFLRPLPITLAIGEVQKDDGTQPKKANSEEPNTNPFLDIPLDPIAYNEVEYQHLSGGRLGMTLLEVDDGSRVSVFPGKATNLSIDDTNKQSTLGDKIQKLSEQTSDEKYKHTVGNCVTIRISDPYRSITRPAENMNVIGIQESRVVYHACISREMTISHETGILCYNSASNSVPVAQLIGPKPFSENLKKMSIKIIDPGEKCTIGIGICPGKTYPANRMPGWNRWSIAYHADDGGIFIEAGFANSHVVKCQKGDVMSMFCDVTTRQLVFYKNDVQVKEIKINVPRGGYWPAIGMHSVGECVKLLEKDPWTQDPEHVPVKPQAFNTYKYGNLWISPARNVSLTKKGYTNTHCGWLILHNPTKFIIGYVITPNALLTNFVGSIGPNETVPLFLKKEASLKEDTVSINWISIEQVKEYTTEEISVLYEAASASSTYSHKLGLTIKTSGLGDIDALQQFNDNLVIDERKLRDGYKLEVFKNSVLVDSYLLKRGRYMLSMQHLDKQAKSYDCIIRRPKCPSFLYPSKLQKGMKVVVKLDDDKESGDQFADAVISEIYDGGGYCFEYTPPGKGAENEKICVGCLECGIEDADWEKIIKKGSKEDMKIRLLSSHSNTSLLDRTYIPAPPHLVTKGSAEAIEMIDPEWKKTTLFNFSMCGQSITRPTVQEQIVTTHSRNLLKWLTYRDSSLPWSVVLLPSQLDGSTLKYPVAKNMFSNVDIHRLCFFQDGYIDMTKMPMVFPSKIKSYPQVRSQYDDINIHSIAISDGIDEKTYPLKQPREICLHMMDLPGFRVQGLVPVDLSYGCLYQAWTYVALLTHKLLLPSYTKIFTGGLGDLDRRQIESLLFQLLQPYASLCSLYSAQYGGLSNQENPTYLSQKIQDLCGGQEQPIPVELLGKGMVSSNHTFVKFPPFLACKAHSHSRVDKNIIRIKDLSLESKFYQPYSEKLDILMVNGNQMKSLPSNLFEIFENLQVLTILDVNLSETPEFPSGIARCKDLEILILSGLPGVKKMATDILTAPALSTFYLHNCPIKTLDIEWPPSRTLTSLSLKGLLINEVPKEIGNLYELNELNLDYNPIITLPDELKKLKKLKYLSVKGIPWIAFEGQFDQMPKAAYQQFNAERPYIVNYLSAEEVDDLFHKFDVNNNNILDPSEVAHLNYEFLKRIPRLGVTKLDDTKFGGVPEVIFSLKSLEVLDLSFTGINCIPDIASELFTLQSLNLEHCPFLESVSGNVGLLPNLRSLHLNSCPVLDSPPPDIVGRGFDSVRAFLKKMAGGYTECHRTKLMFIGLGQAGKTTLLQALKSPLKKTPGTQDAKLTDGIEIKPWVVPVQDGYEITYSCWDFAGQTVYYNTHQFFLSKQAVYMLLWNMRMGFEHAGLDFWLSSIACHCPDTPVIVVGTQLDQIPMPDIPEKELMKKYPQIKKFCYVSSTHGTNIAELEQVLINVTMTYCSQMKLKIPKVWLNFEECILVERRRGQNILDWDVLKQYAITNGIYDEKDIRLAVQFLDDLGTVQYFDTEVLRDRVVINPQWIVDVMAKVVSVNEKSIKESKGRFFHKYISEIWKEYESNLHEWMLKLTERFDLTFPLPDSEDSCNVVPCLLPEEEPEDLPWPVIKDTEDIRESKIQYKFTYLPTGLFNRAQARLFSQGFTDTRLLEFLWKKGSILKKNNHYALVKQTSDYEMIVTVQGPRPKNILDLIHETISTLIKDSFQGVDYDFYIPCPDCVDKEGTKDPFLFKVDLISRAHSVNAPFLQCTKYFHTVSIGELLNIIPDNRETEFDQQIQESISSLQEIRDNMSNDVAILYSVEDIPPQGKEDEMVDPREIHKDLLTAGFKCWFPGDLEETPEAEIELAVKSSKVLVVCMSKNFSYSARCEKTCMHAITALYKPLAIAIIDETDDWKSTQLGLKIGNPKMAMIKNTQRYKKKIEDLVDIVTMHIEEVEKKHLDSHPPVFISYCWANSKIACSNTTVAKDGSLGFGDPRVLKKHLEKNDIRCWIDFEQMGKLGLYQDITVGLQNSRVIVLCVSDEYLESDACMMEARFAAYNLQMPLVVCVVGQGKAWKMSEVSLMVQKYKDLASVIKMQKESDDVYDRAMACVRSYLERPGTEKQQKIQEKLMKQRRKMEQQKKEELEKTIQSGGDTNFSFQEEIELIQRKVMRHISKITRIDDLENELPKLLVFDFVKKESSQKKPEKEEAVSQNNERPITAQSLRARTSSKLSSSLSRDKMKAVTLEELEDDWQGEDFCIRVLCEDEQGWHLVGEPLSLISRTSEEVYKALKDASPYLARIYAVLKQSAIQLNCLSSKKGESFLNYIRKEGIGTKNFSDAYKVIHKMVAESEDRDQFISLLNRCYLQSGKISWLCRDHQNKGGITQLQVGSSSVHGTSRTLIFEEDVLLKELLQASPLYAEQTKGRQGLQKEKTLVKSVSNLSREKLKEAKKDQKKEKKFESSKNEETLKKKKSDKSVTISEKTTKIPSTENSRPTSATNSTGSESITSNSSSARSLSRKKSQRKTTSQACSIQ